jgi:hypothetical protein
MAPVLQKERSKEVVRLEGGRLFQALAAAIGKTLSLSFVCRVTNVTGVVVCAERQSAGDDERQSPLPDEGSPRSMDVQCHQGVNVLEQHGLNCMRSGTSSQWNSQSGQLMCSDLLAEKTGRAVAFKTACCWPRLPVSTAIQ